ncbi:unnamed protein product [Peniophora sp. CBMAI 1063]|nr:unnamed protein product [Peniophora sp. CBMAI 1063]
MDPKPNATLDSKYEKLYAEVVALRRRLTILEKRMHDGQQHTAMHDHDRASPGMVQDIGSFGGVKGIQTSGSRRLNRRGGMGVIASSQTDEIELTAPITASPLSSGMIPSPPTASPNNPPIRTPSRTSFTYADVSGVADSPTESEHTSSTPYKKRSRPQSQATHDYARPTPVDPNDSPTESEHTDSTPYKRRVPRVDIRANQSHTAPASAPILSSSPTLSEASTPTAYTRRLRGGGPVSFVQSTAHRNTSVTGRRRAVRRNGNDSMSLSGEMRRVKPLPAPFFGSVRRTTSDDE